MLHQFENESQLLALWTQVWFLVEISCTEGLVNTITQSTGQISSVDVPQIAFPINLQLILTSMT